MRLFSSLSRHLRKPSSEVVNEQVQNDVSDKANHTGEEKMQVQQTQSKRHFFRGLLKRSGNRSGPSPPPITSNLEVSTLMSPKLQSTMSGPNKPLPPPPLPGNEPEPVMNSTIKLNRIISPIAIADLHKLFSGAPQFFARSEGHGTGAPHPSVAFPWNTELDIRDLCDHVAIQDEAWNAITTWPHVTRRSKGNAEIGSDHENIKAHFSFPYRERPSMLSMQGLERGTMGYQAALELGIADVLRHPDELQEEGAQHNLSERRRRLLNAKDGIRRVTESVLIDRLTNISKAYHEDAAVKHKRPTVELYSELFTQILFPPSRVTDTEDPYSLQVQIEALTDVLVKPVIWFDFSLVEWRIRLGQILWGPSFESDPEDEIVVNDEIANYSGAQKYWLLIQVLLSCELLMRLDAVAANIENRVDEPKPAELKRLEKKATPSLKWSLILGRHWLENIQVSITKSEATTEKKANSWLSSLTRSVAPTDDDIDEIFHNVNFEGRHPQRQLSGLLHFARKLDWPNIDSLSAKLTSTGLAISDSNTLSIAPAVSTPQSVATQQTSSYFGNRPSMPKGLSKQSMSAIIYPSGWLSNSYISGLILPGEALCHFLISTLLESDGTALAQLGDQVNLYGGFSYGGKSFWSTSCIVGRVLAARRGTSECVGWVSSDVVPRGSREAWVNVDVDINFQSRLPSDKDSDARIWDKAAIERHGNVIGGADYSSVLPGDFIIPPDKSPEFSVSVKFEALELIVVTDPYQSTSSVETPTPLTGLSEPLEIRTYSAIMQFSVDRDGMENRKINIPLAKDVHFVTAFPCVASPHTGILKPPINPSVQVSGRGTSPTETLKGHPLHKAFTFTQVSLGALLEKPSNLPIASLVDPSNSPSVCRHQSTSHTTNSPIPKILVVDCVDSTSLAFTTTPIPSPYSARVEEVAKGKHFGSDLEMLARAICAERGWDALISRKGRGCLSCALREASALGYRVVLRFA